MTTNPSPPDWRGLCVELLGALENEGHAHWPGGPDGDPLIEQARAALAQPEPEAVGPSDEEIIAFWSEHCAGDGDAGIIRLARFGGRPAPAPAGVVGELVALLRAEASDDEIEDHLLWMTPADARRAADLLERQAAPVPVDEILAAYRSGAADAAHPTPVPVAERPWEREGWCDEQGQCWMGDPGGCGFIPSWRLCRPEDAPRMRVSLPFHALPLPSVEVEA